MESLGYFRDNLTWTDYWIFLFRLTMTEDLAFVVYLNVVKQNKKKR